MCHAFPAHDGGVDSPFYPSPSPLLRYNQLCSSDLDLSRLPFRSVRQEAAWDSKRSKTKSLLVKHGIVSITDRFVRVADDVRYLYSDLWKQERNRTTSYQRLVPRPTQGQRTTARVAHKRGPTPNPRLAQ